MFFMYFNDWFINLVWIKEKLFQEAQENNGKDGISARYHDYS